MYGNLTRYFRANDDRLTRGGPLAIRPAWWSEFAQVASDGRKPITVTLSVGGNHTEFEGWDWNTGLAIGLKTSSGDYGDPGYLVAPKTYEFAPGTVPSRDFDLRSLRGNAVLRWEWRPGSTLYLAWQQRREDFANVGDFEFDRDRRALFDAPPDDIFLLKVNYWLSP